VLGDLRDLKGVASLHGKEPTVAGFKNLDILNWEFRKRNIGQRETYKFGERKISVDVDYDENLDITGGVAKIIYNEKCNPLQDVTNRYINAEGILRHLTIITTRNSYVLGQFIDSETGSANAIIYLSKGRSFLPHKFTLMELQLLKDMGWKLQERIWKDKDGIEQKTDFFVPPSAHKDTQRRRAILKVMLASNDRVSKAIEGMTPSQVNRRWAVSNMDVLYAKTWVTLNNFVRESNVKAEKKWSIAGESWL
jgi:hypothetical protein